jgi:hypothetical protein
VSATEMVCGWIDGNDLAEAAVAYARRGWHVFPLATRSKLPAIAAKFGGRGVLDATPDEAKARSWWNINNTYNIGIATGIGFWAMDVDPRHGGDETLIALERQHGDLPHTVIGLTGGGGRHVLFKYVAGIRNSARLGRRSSSRRCADRRGAGVADRHGTHAAEGRGRDVARKLAPSCR